MWIYTGKKRPPFAIEPEPGQESVWDYPRPPVARADSRQVIVKLGDVVIAETNKTIRVLETASPPAFYIPPTDVHKNFLQKASGSSMCEWKGRASYWDVVTDGKSALAAGWSYHNPSDRFKEIDGYFSFYPSLVSCYVDGELVQPQPGNFYGGWITTDIAGPVKGEPGTGGW